MAFNLLSNGWKKFLTLFLTPIALIGIVATLVGCGINTPISEEGAARIAKSPHQRDGEFINHEPKADFEFNLSVLLETLFNGKERKPKGTVPIVKISPDYWQEQPSQNLHVAWLGNASTLIEMDKTRILIDPVFSRRASPFSFMGPKRLHESPVELATLSHVDAVLISHNHYDHMDKATIRHLAKEDTRFFVPLGLRDQLEAWDVNPEAIVELDWWQKAKLGNIDVVMTPARHYSSRGFSDYKTTLWGSWSIMGSKNVFFSGDSGYTKQFSEIGKRLGSFDLTLINIGAYGPGQSWHDIHMTPEEAIQVHQDLNGKILLPVHWATFDLALHTWDDPIIRTQKAANAANVKLVVPQIGEIVEPMRAYRNSDWWANLK